MAADEGGGGGGLQDGMLEEECNCVCATVAGLDSVYVRSINGPPENPQ
jgi:hypothetical protein